MEYHKPITKNLKTGQCCNEKNYFWHVEHTRKSNGTSTFTI